MSFGLRGSASTPDRLAKAGRESTRHRLQCDGSAEDDRLLEADAEHNEEIQGSETDEVGPDVFLRRARSASASSERPKRSERRDRPAPTPSHRLFIGGIGQISTDGDSDIVRALFRGIAHIEDVRMGKASCVVRVRTVSEAVAIMEEHRRRRFEHGGRRLAIHYVTEEPGNQTKTLFIRGFTGGEQRVREMLGSWADAALKIFGGKAEGADVAWVEFPDRDAAQEAMQTLWALYPDLSVDWAKSDPRPEYDVGEPSQTLCIVGFAGSKQELRRYLGDYRQTIIDVRIPPTHADGDRWDFVFVKFKSKIHAIDAYDALAQIPHFRVRYMRPGEKGGHDRS